MTDDTKNGTRSPEEIERDIALERQQLRDTIDEALSRFTFEDAWNRAGGYLKENRSEFGHTFGRVLRERPMGVILTAVGLTWLFFGPKETVKRRSSSSRRVEADTERKSHDQGTVGPIAENGRKTGQSGINHDRVPPVVPKEAQLRPERDDTAAMPGSGSAQPDPVDSPFFSANTPLGEPARSSTPSSAPVSPTLGSDRRT